MRAIGEIAQLSIYRRYSSLGFHRVYLSDTDSELRLQSPPEVVCVVYSIREEFLHCRAAVYRANQITNQPTKQKTRDTHKIFFLFVLSVIRLVRFSFVRSFALHAMVCFLHETKCVFRFLEYKVVLLLVHMCLCL